MSYIRTIRSIFDGRYGKTLVFSFDSACADIDPDAELGPLYKRDYATIDYHVPEMRVAGDVVIADATDRNEPLLWSNMRERYGDEAVDGNDLAKAGYLRIYRKKGFGCLPNISDTQRIAREFVLERNFSMLPPKYAMSFIVRPQSGEVYHEYYGDKYDEVAFAWHEGNFDANYVNHGKKESYILSDWIFHVRYDYVLSVVRIIDVHS